MRRSLLTLWLLTWLLTGTALPQAPAAGPCDALAAAGLPLPHAELLRPGSSIELINMTRQWLLPC